MPLKVGDRHRERERERQSRWTHASFTLLFLHEPYLHSHPSLRVTIFWDPQVKSGGQSGQFRANSDQIGWKGASGRAFVAVLWFQGCFNQLGGFKETSKVAQDQTLNKREHQKLHRLLFKVAWACAVPGPERMF